MKVPFVHILPLFTIFAEAYAANFDLEAIAGIGAEKRMLQEGGTSTICSSDTPCPAGEFCGYQQDDTGSCVSCSVLVNRYELNYCTRYWDWDILKLLGSEKPAATQDCAEKCFSPCNRGATFDTTSGGLEFTCDDRSFCNRALDPSSDVGYCDSCSNIGGVQNCELRAARTGSSSAYQEGDADPASVAECEAVCFKKCNEDQPCDGGSFCSIDKDDDTGNGFCAACADTFDCFDVMNLSPASQATCNSTCFTAVDPEPPTSTASASFKSKHSLIFAAMIVSSFIPTFGVLHVIPK